ncbi:MAG TPA: ATP synthase F0 subunit B [Candidatus Dormibacteraeota bacterium]|jgi:F-type H+-transporting ATPase subunit b|nr:ATP synthase F0 subunit B [Candidatus Dormibacteraeota bacterium]
MTNQIASGKKIFGAWLLALLFVLGLTGAAAPLRAQDQVAAPQKQEPATPQKRERQHDESIGRQLAHETREAAGEEEKDDTAEFKQSPAVRLIANWTGMSLQHAYWLAVLSNFFVIAVVLIWAARKYLPAAFSARTAAIQKAMQEAQKASEDARRRLAEIESRLMRLDVEIGMMRDSAEKEAAAEEARIQAAAQEEAHKLVASAQQEIASAAKTARRELAAYAADLAIGLAQKQIHVDTATDKVLVRNFSEQLGTADPRNGPGKGSH